MEDYPMRTYDLTPFYRSTVGFDRFFSLLDQAAAQNPASVSRPLAEIGQEEAGMPRVARAAFRLLEAVGSAWHSRHTHSRTRRNRAFRGCGRTGGSPTSSRRVSGRRAASS